VAARTVRQVHPLVCVEIVFNAQKSGCHVDQVIEVVGDYLRGARSSVNVVPTVRRDDVA